MIPFVSVSYAATDMQAFGRVIDPIIANIINPIIGFMFALAVVVFAFGVLKMIISGGEADARSTAKASILWGLVGMFIMVSAWGIVSLISNTIDETSTGVMQR